eukprot:1178678-Prorocentrum_minimum.AAC.3
MGLVEDRHLEHSPETMSGCICICIGNICLSELREASGKNALGCVPTLSSLFRAERATHFFLKLVPLVPHRLGRTCYPVTYSFVPVASCICSFRMGVQVAGKACHQKLVVSNNQLLAAWRTPCVKNHYFTGVEKQRSDSELVQPSHPVHTNHLMWVLSSLSSMSSKLSHGIHYGVVFASVLDTHQRTAVVVHRHPAGL